MLKFILASLSMALLTTACSHSRTYSTHDGSVTVDQTGKDSASFKISGKDGKVSMDINSGKDIVDYPAEVPLYKGKSLYDMKTAEKHSRSVSLETTDPAEKVAAFYKQELDRGGWKIETSLSTTPVTMFTANKDGRELVIQIMSDEKKRVITQSLADK